MKVEAKVEDDRSHEKEEYRRTGNILPVGTAKTRGISRTSVQNGIEEEEKTSTLWHQRLGHMSEKGMKILAETSGGG